MTGGPGLADVGIQAIAGALSARYPDLTMGQSEIVAGEILRKIASVIGQGLSLAVVRRARRAGP